LKDNFKRFRMPSIFSIDQDIVWLAFAGALLLAGILIGFALGQPARNRERTVQADRDAAREELESLRATSEQAQADVMAARAAVARVSALEDKLVAAGRQAANGERVPALESEIAALRDHIVGLTSENTRLEEAHRAADTARAETVATLTALRDEVEERIAASVDAALQRHQAAVLGTVQQVLDDHHRRADAGLQAHHSWIDGLVKPVGETLEKCQQRLAFLEQGSVKAAATPRAPRRERSRSAARGAAPDAPVEDAVADGADGSGHNGTQPPVALVAASAG
jgi:hypothetical protein